MGSKPGGAATGISGLMGLGAAYLAQAQYDNADKEYRKVLRLWPNLLEAHHQLGLTLYRRGVRAFRD